MKRHTFRSVGHFAALAFLLIGRPIAWAETRTAVLPFQMAGITNASRDWNAGLSELLELELQGRQVPLYTRRFIGLVLKERKLDTEGSFRDSSLVRQVLPDVDYLVKGIIARTGDKQFSLEVKVADAHSGQEIQSFAGSGVYPKDLIAAIEAAGAQLAPTLSQAQAAATNAAFFSGYTRVPEALSPFYEGIEAALAGRPAYAIESFNRATDCDERFLLAIVWRMRCYEALRLPDHAALEYKNLLERQARYKISFVGSVNPTNTGVTHLVTVLFSNGKWAFTSDQKAVIKAGLRTTAGLAVFTPEWLNEMTDESDLRLSGEFGLLEKVDPRAWLQAEYAALFEAKGEATNPSVDMRLINLITGLTRCHTLVPAGQIDTIGDRIASLLSGVGDVTNEAQQTSWEPVAPDTVRSFGLYDRRVFTRNLVALAKDPTNRLCMRELADSYPEMETLHRHFLMLKYIESMDSRDMTVEWKRKRIDMLGIYDPENIIGVASNDPDFLYLTYHVLYKKNEKLWRVGSKPDSLLDAYQSYLVRYSNSWETACLRYSLGAIGSSRKDGWMKYGANLMRGADEILAQMPKGADGRLDVNMIGSVNQEIVYRAMIQAAYAACRTGLFEKASGYLKRLAEVNLPAGGIQLPYIAATPRSATETNPYQLMEMHPLLTFCINGMRYQYSRDLVIFLEYMIAQRKPEMLTLPELFGKIETLNGTEAYETGVQYCKLLDYSLQQKGFRGVDVLWIQTPPILRKMAETCRPEQMQQVMDWGIRFSETDGSRIGDARNQILLASRNYKRLREIIETPARAGDYTAFCYMGALIRSESNDPEAESRYFLDLLPQLEQRIGALNLWGHYMYVSKVCEKDGKWGIAADSYEKAIGARSPSEEKYSAMYRLAAVEWKRGNSLRAVDLLKDLIRDPRSRGWRLRWVVENGVDGQGNSLYVEALSLLDKIRLKAETNK